MVDCFRGVKLMTTEDQKEEPPNPMAEELGERGPCGVQRRL
jgi:hypothetical protein